MVCSTTIRGDVVARACPSVRGLPRIQVLSWPWLPTVITEMVAAEPVVLAPRWHLKDGHHTQAITAHRQLCSGGLLASEPSGLISRSVLPLCSI